MTPIKAIAVKLAHGNPEVGVWYMRLAQAAPEITWDDVKRLRNFTPRRSLISLCVRAALA